MDYPYEEKPSIHFPGLSEPEPCFPKTTKVRPKVYNCTEEGCDKSYSRPSLLIQHLRSHSNERPFVCPAVNCGKSFLRDSHLKAHMLSHTDTKPLSCDVCGKGFNTNQHLNRHRKTHYPSHVCTYPGCNTSFRRHLQLRKHISEVHTKEKAFKCTHEDCVAAFDQKSRLDVHITKAHSPFPRYQCGHETCDQKFSLWSSLQQHIKNDHKRIPCALCGKPCTGPDGIEQHLQQVHPESEVASVVLASINATTIIGEQASQGSSKRSATRRWMCSEPDCNLFFSRKYLLLDHYKEEHGFIPEHLRHRSSRSNTPTSMGSEHDLELDISDASLADPAARLQMKRFEEIEPSVKRQKTNDEEKKPSTTSERSMIDIITGAAYESADRNIHCLIEDCPYKFYRDYDLKRHLETVHKTELFNGPIVPNESVIPDIDHLQQQHQHIHHQQQHHHHQQQQQHHQQHQHLQIQLEQHHNSLPHQEHNPNSHPHDDLHQQHILHQHQQHQQHHHHENQPQHHHVHEHHNHQNPIGFMEPLQHHASSLNGNVTNGPTEIIPGFGVIDLSEPTGLEITALNNNNNHNHSHNQEINVHEHNHNLNHITPTDHSAASEIDPLLMK